MSNSPNRKFAAYLNRFILIAISLCFAALIFIPRAAFSQSTGTQSANPPAAQSTTPQAAAQQPAPPQQPAQPADGKISGVVKSGSTPIPGATVLVVNFDTRQRSVTTTDINGNFLFSGLANGRYFIAVQMMAFAPGRSMAQLDAKNQSARVDIDLTLASRVPPEERGQFGAAGARNGRPGAGIPGAAPGQQGAPPQGFPAGAEDLAQMAGGAAAGADETGQDASAASQSVPGMQGAAADTATESVAIGGNMSSGQMRGMSSAEIQSRVQEFQQQRDFMGGGGQFRGGPGGRGGEGGGGFVMFRGGGRRGFDQPHGALFYTLGDSALNASPYSLTGAPVTKPSFVQHNFGASLGGPLNIPKIYKGGFKNFFFASYNGTLSQSPFDQFSTVPTPAERAGDFSALGNPVYDPATGNPDGTGRTQFVSFPTGAGANSLCTNAAGCPNMIPTARITTQANSLLNFIPNPNLSGAVQNFHFVTSTTNNSNSFNFRLIHNFGASSTALPFQRRGGIRNSLNVGFSYRDSKNELTNAFPGLGGNTTTRSFNIPVGFSHTFSNKLTNMARFDFNRSRTQTQNLFAFLTNVAGQAGIGGVSPNPFDWGVPNLSFTDFSGVSDVNPNLGRDQTFTYSDTMALTVGKHTLRWGADFRRIQINTETSSDPRGSFTFNDFNTALFVASPTPGQPAVQQPATGFDFADYLLGLPVQSRIQCGSNSTGACVGSGNYHFRGNSWDLFLQDDWHMRGNFTVFLGLRYEYVSPFIETANQLANLDFAPGFTAIAPVQPGQTGPFTGAFPKTLVNPDRDNIAPRLGIAWKPLKNTVVRSGYGINFNTGAYNSIVQQLAFQPPFSLTETNIESSSVPLSLASGFPAPSSGTITNSYAVNRNYQLGYVQIWNLDVQQELSKTLLLNVDYTGSKGTNLDILEDPNRTPTGLLIPNSQPFNLETAEGDSILHAGTLRLRKRLSSGVSIGGTYTYSKSIDNASSIGGGGSTVAQNAFDLAAERGVSSFDQRHRFTGDYLWELPLGPDRHWLAQKGFRQALFGGWEWSGDWTISSGLPFTANILGNSAEIARGTNGTLRADSTGQPVALAHPTTAAWFNVNAFTEPATGNFGNVGRNTIRGPGTLSWDMAATKVIPFGESRMLEIRAQADNVFNRPQFSAIDTTLGTAAFGQVTGVGSMRTIQIVTRFRF